MKVQVKRAFKGYFFCHQKNKKKADRFCMKFSSTFNTRCRVAYIPYFKIYAPIFCCFIFFEECLKPQVRIYKMLNERTVDYHLSSSKFTSRIHPLIFLWTPKGFISPEYFLIFFSDLYIPPWLKNMFQIHGVKITEKYIYESKNWICSFLLMPPSKTLPRFLSSLLQAEWNYPFPSNKNF